MPFRPTLSDLTEPELREVMTRTARAAKGELPRGSQFVILAWDESNIAQYIATCERANMIKFLRETADRLESREDVTR